MDLIRGTILLHSLSNRRPRDGSIQRCGEVMTQYAGCPMMNNQQRCTMVGAFLIIAMTFIGGKDGAVVAASETLTLTRTMQAFDDDVAFLSKHTAVIVLSDKSGAARVALAPAWQGRVMTSTAEHGSGRSFGWINRELIASGKTMPHINVFGGEDRLWLGPEGGQFSIFFAKGAPFDTEHWFVPKWLDTAPFQTVSRSKDRAVFRSQFLLANYSGTSFEVAVNREVRLLEPKAAWTHLGLPPSKNIALVVYESNNTLVNAGKQPWKKDTGLLSVWILGMYPPAPSATIVAPIKPGPESELGVKVTADYFGIVPPDRLRVTDRTVLLSGDGEFRSKIGISPRRSLGVQGSYDADQRVLTIVQFKQPPGVDDYVNSSWKLQDNPYAGDVANSYNDGPPAPGVKPLGPFFEIESSSPAAALPPGGSIEHTHRTFHLMGPEGELDSVARVVLGVSLGEIKAGLHRN
jgi:hypothetical protein